MWLSSQGLPRVPKTLGLIPGTTKINQSMKNKQESTILMGPFKQIRLFLEHK